MAGTTPVAQYGKLDNTTQTFSAYKAGIDANSVASLRIVGRLRNPVDREHGFRLIVNTQSS